MLDFDDNGYLQPYKAMELDFKVFENQFSRNRQRKMLFAEYLLFVEDLKKIVGKEFKQWIDGSYVTLKILPNDIDVVTFIPFQMYLNYESLLLDLNQKYPKIDAYFVPLYPPTHKYAYVTTYREGDWRKIYGQDRFDRKKGFIQLNFY